jgi:hypothetical protein
MESEYTLQHVLNYCIAGFALTRVIRRIRFKKFLGNSDRRTEWFVPVDRQT